MTFKNTFAIPIIIEPNIYQDNRGLFLEAYNEKRFHEHSITDYFVQDNISYSKQGTIRGLHFQNEPMTQAKLVRVLQGAVLDVAVDIRKDSPTAGKYVGEILTGSNKKSMYIPKGFAHGFIALEDSLFMYKVSNHYSKEHENGIIWNDPDIEIDWHIADDMDLLISDKDKQNQTFKEYMNKL